MNCSRISLLGRNHHHHHNNSNLYRSNSNLFGNNLARTIKEGSNSEKEDAEDEEDFIGTTHRKLAAKICATTVDDE